MRITESRLRRIIRETLAQMGGRGTGVTVEDVDGVLSALITGPLWDPEAAAAVKEELLGLAVGSGGWVLSGIKGWIDREEEMGNTTPGFKLAGDLIEGIAQREGISIVDDDIDGTGQVHDLIDRAYTA